MKTMPANAMLSPMFALAAWTMCVLLLVAFRRLRAGFSGQVSPREFALGESSKVPANVALPNRNYMNLLELPVLFYVICLIAHETSAVTATTVGLAWTYVALRMVHSVIHITYNHILHRFLAFAASNFALIALWVMVGTGLFRTAPA
jgi:hypothetical protein